MLLEEDVVMNVEEFRLPPSPSREAPPRQAPLPPEEQCQGDDDVPPIPISPPPIPWPRVFPSL
jgi:hypothetical protein